MYKKISGEIYDYGQNFRRKGVGTHTLLTLACYLKSFPICSRYVILIVKYHIVCFNLPCYVGVNKS